MINTNFFKKYINDFLKQKTYDTNDFKTTIYYFCFAFILEQSQLFNLYGTNLIRRAFNMVRRKDELSYSHNLKPFAVNEKNFLNEQDIKSLKEIKVPTTRDISGGGRNDTSTYIYKKMNEKEQSIIRDIQNKAKERYENVIGKKLYNWPEETSNLYTYYGANAKHDWHADPQNVDYIYNLIVCIDKVGNISPFQYKDKDKNVHSYYTNEGDAILFNGGTTMHQIPPSNDPDSKRTVLSMSFTSIEPEKIPNKGFNSKNLCTWLEGANNYFNLFTIWALVFFTNLFISYITGTSNINIKFLLVLYVVVIIIFKYVPLYFNIGLGSGRPGSLTYSIYPLLLSFLLFTLSVRGGILLFSYFVLTDIFFPKSWIAYD